MECKDDLTVPCPSCGAQVNTDDRFCGHCGSRLATKSNEDHEFVTEGSRLLGTEIYVPKNASHAEKRPPHYLFLGVLGAVFVLAIIFAWFKQIPTPSIENPPSTETDLDQRFVGPDGFKDIKFGMTPGEVKRILGNHNAEIEKCQGRSTVECDQMMEVWESDYFTLPDIKSYHAKLLFYENVGLYRIVKWRSRAFSFSGAP